jgi:hypothetical protein
MPLTSGDVIRVSVRQSGHAGQDIVNVYHFEASDNITDSDATILADIADHFDTVYANIEAYIPAGQSPQDIKVDVVELVGEEEVITRNVGTIGWGVDYQPTGTGDVYAYGVAVGIILRTLVGKVFGRKFVGTLVEAAMGDNNLLSGATTTAFATFASALTGAIVETGGSLIAGVLSKKLGAFAEFVEADLATEPFYQRRRAVRAGS